MKPGRVIRDPLRGMMAAFYFFGVAEMGSGVWDLFAGNPLNALGLAVTGVLLCTLPRGVNLGFRRGYWAGRRSMWESMNEAAHRGMEPNEWVRGERERDIADRRIEFGP